MLDKQELRLLRLLPGAIIAADAEGAIRFISEPACKILDYKDSSELLGRSLTSIMPARFVKPHVEGFDQYLKTGRSKVLGKRIRARVLTRTGQERPIELSIRMFRRPDGTDLIIAGMALASMKEEYVEFSLTRMEGELTDRDYTSAQS